MDIEPFFDAQTWTLTYVVYDRAASQAVVIDPVLDFDPASGRTWTDSADAVAAFLEREQLEVSYVLDTHAHADHLTALPYFKEHFDASTVIGARIVDVQRVARDLFNLGHDDPDDGSQFDVLLEDGDTLGFGSLELEAIHTPGHTPACMTYRVGDALFVGDAIFQPDYGTARCDFPGGSAAALFASINRLYERFPAGTRTFTCHDYQPGGRDLAFESTIGEQREKNIQLNSGTSRAQFVALREERDGSLSLPTLILPSIQVNARAGEPPLAEENGVSYLKLPLNLLGTT